MKDDHSAVPGDAAPRLDGVAPEDRAIGGMKVLIVTRGVLPLGPRAGGAELVAFRLASTLASEGHEVVLVSDVDELPEPLPASCRVVAVRRHRSLLERFPSQFSRWVAQHFVGNVRAARAARRELRSAGKRPFDAVHVHGALAAVLLSRPPRPLALVYTEHDSTPWSCRYRRRVERVVRVALYRAVNLRACRAADAVATPFPALAVELAARSKMPRSHFHIVLNAMHKPRPAPGAAPAAARCPQSRPEGHESYFVFVGQLTDRKGPDVLLRALALRPHRCVFIGDGPMRPRLEQLAAQLELADLVEFLGALPGPEVLELCRQADALVLPSFAEGLPLVILEAFSCGTPVIASDVAGIPSVVIDGKTGLLVPPGDIDRLAEALVRLGSDGELRNLLGREAELLAEEHPDYPDAVVRYLKLYRELLVAARAPAHG